MKKKSTRKPSAKSTTVADECAAYRANGNFSEYVCEIEPFLKQEPEMRIRLLKSLNSPMGKVIEVHHIYGRVNKCEESNWHTALVQVFKASHHDCGHDFNPLILEVVSLKAKLDRQWQHEQRQLIGLEPPNTPPNRLHWNLPVLDLLCKKKHSNPTLAGRIEGILIPRLSEFPVFQQMAKEILAKINGV